MGHQFEQHQDAEVPASPDDVWAAIATGPGIDSWFMGRNEVQPGPGGIVRTVFGEYAPELAVTGWDPARRFAYRSGEAPDGRFIAYEFLIEGQAGGSTVLRTVTSGFIPGDDRADEFEAMTLGGEMYFRTLVEYLTPAHLPWPPSRAGSPPRSPRSARRVPTGPGSWRCYAGASGWPDPQAAVTARASPSTDLGLRRVLSILLMPTRSAYGRRTRSTGSSAASASR